MFKESKKVMVGLWTVLKPATPRLETLTASVKPWIHWFQAGCALVQAWTYGFGSDLRSYRHGFGSLTTLSQAEEHQYQAEQLLS